MPVVYDMRCFDIGQNIQVPTASVQTTASARHALRATKADVALARAPTAALAVSCYLLLTIFRCPGPPH